MSKAAETIVNVDPLSEAYRHIHPTFRPVLFGSDEQRVAFVDQPRWIGYPRATLALDTLKALMDKPLQPRMPNLLVVGESNNGKSTLIARFVSLCGQGYVDENADPVTPVIVAESPPYADEKGLYISILERFWAPYRATAPAAQLRYEVIHQLRNCKVRVLVLDEMHSLLSGTARQVRDIMNVLKLLCNAAGVSIVGVGTREAVRALHTDPQHASRFTVLTLPLWELDEEFQKLLAGFECVLPLKRPSALADAKTATLIHTISGGNLGNVRELLQACARDAIHKGEERITLKILESHRHMQPTKGYRELT